MDVGYPARVNASSRARGRQWAIGASIIPADIGAQVRSLSKDAQKMTSANLATNLAAPADDPAEYIFEPHVATDDTSRAHQLSRHWDALGSMGELMRGGDALWAGQANPGRASHIVRHSFESSIRLVEAASTGTARMLAARSCSHLVDAQLELLTAYRDWLSFVLGAFARRE